MKCLIFICSLFSFQLFIMFNFAIVTESTESLFLHVLFAAAYFMVILSYCFNHFLMFDEEYWKLLRICVTQVPFILNCAKRMPTSIRNRITYQNPPKNCKLIPSKIKSILSQIKNLFHSISKIVLHHPALTQVSVGFCIHKRFGWMFGLCIHKINFLRFSRVIANLLCADFSLDSVLFATLLSTFTLSIVDVNMRRIVFGQFEFVGS